VIPGQVLALIEDTPSAELPGITTERHTCQGAKFHSPRPMIVHSFRMGQEGDEGEIVYLCGTCTDNVQVLLTLLKGRGGEVSWPVKRCFGNLVRSVADQAYAHPSEETHHA
jgi:hypothetical protein